ncbi:DUF503 domain-containing protein [Sporomusa aerivorans]|uniref:DUF503 domain-containing protein n=1 Tax=Sporomusa aerivorans TaxID=204936 RepID=UPI00352B652F
MHVMVGSIELLLPGAGSLKEKRHVVKSIVGRIRSRVNASVAETEFQDVWQRSVIGVAMVSSDRQLLDKQVSIIRTIVDDNAAAETVEFLFEYV